MTMKELTTALGGVDATSGLDAVNKKLDALIEGEAPEPETAPEDAVEGNEEEVKPADEGKETEEVAEPEAAPEAEAEAEPETDEDEAEAEEGDKEMSVSADSEMKKVLAQVTSVIAENKELRASLAEAEKKLAAKEKAERDFVEKFKTLSVSLSTESDAEFAESAEAPVVENVFTDGIGDLA